MHGFTHETATGQQPGVLYHAQTDARSSAAIAPARERDLMLDVRGRNANPRSEASSRYECESQTRIRIARTVHAAIGASLS